METEQRRRLNLKKIILTQKISEKEYRHYQTRQICVI